MKRLLSSLVLLIALTLNAYAAAGLLLVKYPTLAIAGTPTTTGTLGVAYTPWTATVTGGRGASTCSDLNGALPPGITVDANSCVTSGTPTSAGTYTNIVIRATDTVGHTADLSPPFQIAVTPGVLTTLVPSNTWTGTAILPPDPVGWTGAPLPSAGGAGQCDIYNQIGSGFSECPVGNFDTYPNIALESTNSPLAITVGAAHGDRSWIDYVKCYMEGGSIIIAGQTKNATTGSLGWTFKVGPPSSGQDGLAKVYCDIVPVKGYTRRIATNVWINANTSGGTCGTAVQCGYIDRSDKAFYVNPTTSSITNGANTAAAGVDPAGNNVTCVSPATTAHMTVDSTGLNASIDDCSTSGGVNFSGGSNTPIITFTSGGVNYMTQVDCSLIPSASSGFGISRCVSGVNTNIPLSSPLPAGLAHFTWSNNTSCGSSPGTGSNPGSLGHPYKTIGTALNCMVTNGGTIYVPDGTTLNEPALRVAVNGSAKSNTRIYQVLACKDFPTCADKTGLYTISSIEPRGVLLFNAANVAFQNVTWNMGTIQSLQGCNTATGAACAGANSVGAAYPCVSCRFDDPNGAGGPVIGGYYAGKTPTQTANIVNIGAWSALESEITNPSIDNFRLLRNTNVSLTWDAVNFIGSNGIRFFNLDVAVPVGLSVPNGGSAAFVPMKQSLSYDKSMTVYQLAYNAGTGNSTFTVYPMEGSPASFNEILECASCANLPTGYQWGELTGLLGNLITWNVCNVTTGCTVNGRPAGYRNCGDDGGTPGGIGGCTVTAIGINLVATGLQNGDTIWIWNPAHPDANQWVSQKSSATVGSQNIYEQRYRFIGDQQVFLGQGGGYQSNGTITTGSPNASTVATLSNATDFSAIQVTDGIEIVGGTRCDGSSTCTSGQNQFQERQVVTKCLGGFFTDVNLKSNGTACSGNTIQIDTAFSPDIASGLTFIQNKAAFDWACVACRIGGSSFNLSDAGQFQNNHINFVMVQNSDVYQGANTNPMQFIHNTLTCSGKMNTGPNSATCSGETMKDFNIFDSAVQALISGVCCSTGHPVWTDVSQVVGYNFDNNHYLSITDGSRTQNPGTNQSCPAASGCPAGNYNVHFADKTYTPSSELTHAVVGTVGNTQVPDGTPLFPWDADGTAIAAGALVGAMQLQVAPSQWDVLKTGGGGFVTGIDIAADGTKVVRTDTYGGYVWNGTAWAQLVTKTSMPAADFGFNGSGDSLSGGGVYEVAIAPSNTAHFYMIYNGRVFSSTNSGATWTRASPAQDTALDPNSGTRWYGPHLAVDPNNENIVYAGEGTNGLFVSTNAGSSWSSVGSVAAADATGYAIAFDPNSTHPGNVTQGIYACANATGCYHSTDGGTTWTLTSSGPTGLQDLIVTSAGVVWAVSSAPAGQLVWKYTGTWTNVNTGSQGTGARSIAVNGANIYVAKFSAQITISTDSGATWTPPNFDDKLTSADVPWLGLTKNFPSSSTAGRIRWDANASRLYQSNGIGVMYTATPLSSGTVWTDQTAGIENMVGVKVLSTPTGGLVHYEYDRPVFQVADPTVYPATQGPNNNNALIAGWDGDYATTNSDYITLFGNFNGVNQSSYSTNKGLTWTLFPTQPPLAGDGEYSAATSSPLNDVVAQSFGQMYYTKDGGNTWTASTVPGGNGGWGGGQQFLNRHIVCADRITLGTYYAYGGTSKGVYSSTDGGATWTKVHTGALNAFDNFNTIMRCVPGHAGHLFWTAGNVGGSTSGSFYRSTDGGASWLALPNVLEVYGFGFGAPQTAGGYPAVYIFGWVSGTPGIYRSDNADQATPTWTQLGSDAFPLGSNDQITWVEGDLTVFGKAYVAFRGSSFAYWH